MIKAYRVILLLCTSLTGCATYDMPMGREALVSPAVMPNCFMDCRITVLQDKVMSNPALVTLTMGAKTGTVTDTNTKTLTQ